MGNWYFLRDGGQFGPLSWEDLWRQGQTGGLRPSDLVWTDGMPEWRAAASVPSLFPVPQPAPASIPQNPPYRPQGAPYAQPSPQPAAYHPAAAQPAPRRLADDPVMRMVLPVGRSMWAIIAGYLGLLSFLVVFAPFALATGIFAVIDIKRNPEKHGMGRAIFGIVMGALGSIILAIMLVVWASEGN